MFFWKEWFRRHQSPLLQAKLHQSGVTEMLMVWEIRENLIIGNQILCVAEGDAQEFGVEVVESFRVLQVAGFG